MDIKEIGACGVVVVGGAVFGVSQFGLNDVLTEELKTYAEVSDADRESYMNSVVAQFDDAFEVYGIQTDTYLYVGNSTFTADPLRGLFVEVIKQDSEVPKSERPKMLDKLKVDEFCIQDEMVMFTDKGWNYRTTIKDSTSQTIATIICSPHGNQRTV